MEDEDEEGGPEGREGGRKEGRVGRRREGGRHSQERAEEAERVESENRADAFRFCDHSFSFRSMNWAGGTNEDWMAVPTR